MSEKISKISVDGVVYDIASTGGGEVPGDIQEQLSALENKVTEEASAREEGDAKLSEKIESEASRVDGMVNQINENVASIETLNNNLVQAIETINNGIAAEVTNREEGDAKLQAAIDAIPPVDLTPYVSDVAGLSNTLEALNATVQILQSKVDVLTKTNTEVVSVDGSAGELKDSSKDYIVSGSINENAEIVGKSISLKSIKVSDNARLKLNAGDVEAKDLNISGSFPKANGNTVISVNNAEFIVFKDMVFDASEVYNGIEIGLASNSVLPKNILFDNCKFQGEFSNNAILVFGTQDNAIITLNNCYFEKISNALRLSNKSNASGVVVNINNCTVDQWETGAPWQGFLICEDYTNKTEEEVNANNLFGDGKITVNFNNLVHAGVKINPADPASVCGTKNESQVVMVCQDAVAGPEGDYCLSYDAAKFPVVSFK